MIVNINGARFDVSPALANSIEAAVALAAREVEKVWGDMSDATSQRAGAKNIIRAYLDKVR